MSTESIRTAASQQYFEIRNELNRGNKTKNLKTELEFEIRQNSDEYYIIIKSSGAEHGLRLAYKRKKTVNRWLPLDNELYKDFYNYMFLKINNLNQNDVLNINDTLTSWLLRLWIF